MRLYLIRHGETDYNKNRVFQGHAEIPLNDTGIEQATRLGLRLRELPLDQIYSSDLRRAAMTASILASHTGAPLAYDPGFRERDPGDLTHRPYDDATGFFGDPAYMPPGGEGYVAFEERVRIAFDDLAEREGRTRRNIAVVTHGMVCASFLRNHLRLPPQDQGEVRWRNTSLTIADYDGHWRLVVLSDAAHLDDQEAAAVSSTGA